MARKFGGGNEKRGGNEKGKKTYQGRGKGTKYPSNPKNKKYKKKYRGQGRRRETCIMTQQEKF